MPNNAKFVVLTGATRGLGRAMAERFIAQGHRVARHAPVIAQRHLAVLETNVRRFARGEALLNVCEKARWY